MEKKTAIVTILLLMFHVGCGRSTGSDGESMELINLETGMRNDDVLPNTWEFRRGLDLDGEGARVGWYRDDLRLGDTVRFPIYPPDGATITQIAAFWFQDHEAVFDMRLILVRSNNEGVEDLGTMVISEFGTVNYQEGEMGVMIDRENYSYSIELLGAGDLANVVTAVTEIQIRYD